MRTIALISLLIFLSFSYEAETPLTPFIKSFLLRLNQHLSEPIKASERENRQKALIKVTFEEIKENDVIYSLEGNNLIHLAIPNIKANAEGNFITSSRKNDPVIVSIKGEAITSINMTLTIDTEFQRDGNSQRKIRVAITDLTTSTNLNSDFDKYNNVEYSEMYEDLKEEIEDKIYALISEKELKKLTSKAFENMY